MLTQRSSYFQQLLWQEKYREEYSQPHQEFLWQESLQWYIPLKKSLLKLQTDASRLPFEKLFLLSIPEIKSNCKIILISVCSHPEILNRLARLVGLAPLTNFCWIDLGFGGFFGEVGVWGKARFSWPTKFIATDYGWGGKGIWQSRTRPLHQKIHQILNLLGGVSEWPKEHAWKACIRYKRIVGSNPTSSEFFVG